MTTGMNTITRQALLLATKDTRIFFRDRAALAFAFLLPFIFVIGFSLALRDVGPEDEALQFTLATQETAGISVLAIDSIATDPEGPIRAMEHDEAMAAVDSGGLAGFVSFPADFTQRYLAGETAPLEVHVGDVPPADEAAMLGFAQEIASRFSEARATLSAVIALGNPQDAARAMERLLADTSAPAIDLRVEQLGEIAPFNTSNFVLPGYLTMFVFFTAAMGAEALARERQTHTLERLMANGVRRGVADRGQVPGWRAHRRGAGGGDVDRGRAGVQRGPGSVARGGDRAIATDGAGLRSLCGPAGQLCYQREDGIGSRSADVASACAHRGELVAAVHHAVVHAVAGAPDAARVGQRRAEQADAVRRGVHRRTAVDAGAGSLRGGVPVAGAVALPPGAGGVGV